MIPQLIKPKALKKEQNESKNVNKNNTKENKITSKRGQTWKKLQQKKAADN